MGTPGLSVFRRAFAACAGAVLSVGTVIGCTADRSVEAERIGVELRSVPGVASVDVGYVNDFENGANVTIELDMVDATEEQVGAVARRVDDLVTTTFDDHRRTTTIAIADSTSLEYQGRIDADAVPAETRLLRALPRPPGTVGWLHSDNQSRLEIWNSAAPESDLRAVLAQASSVAPDVVYVRSAAPRERSSWEVRLPLTVVQMEAAVAVRDSLPVVVFQADVRVGRITGMSVDLGTSDAAYRNAMTIVNRLTPTPATPLTVEWRLADAPPGEIGTFTACSPPAGVPDRTVASFAALKSLLQEQFPGCAQ